MRGVSGFGIRLSIFGQEPKPSYSRAGQDANCATADKLSGVAQHQ